MPIVGSTVVGGGDDPQINRRAVVRVGGCEVGEAHIAEVQVGRASRGAHTTQVAVGDGGQ